MRTFVAALAPALLAFLIGCTSPSPSRAPRSAGGAPAPARGAASATPAFKGYELYSWLSPAGEWRYAILEGTNRLKSSEEIRQAALPEDRLRSELQTLAAGENVTWCPPPGGDAGFRYPPDEVVDRLVDLARTEGFALVLCH